MKRGPQVDARQARLVRFHPAEIPELAANFVEAVRTRTPVIEDSVFGLRAAGPALLCNVSQREKRPVSWNPETMRQVESAT